MADDLATPPLPAKQRSRQAIRSWQIAPKQGDNKSKFIKTAYESGDGRNSLDAIARGPKHGERKRHSIASSESKDVGTKHEVTEEPYPQTEEVGFRAMRKLSRPARLIMNDLEQGPISPPLTASPMTSDLSTPYTRRDRRPSTTSTISTASSMEDSERPDPHNPNTIFKLKHTPTAVQTQLSLLETIDKLKHAASVTPSSPTSQSARYAYAKYLIENLRYLETGQKTYLDEGLKILRELSKEGYADAQFTFGCLLITGVPGSQMRHKPDYEKAFPLYLRAAKKGHADATYHAALCYEHGRGTNAPPDPASAVKKYRKAAIAHHPGAMYRLGMILANGELGQPRNISSSIKWLNLSARYATPKHPHALYQLALLHEHDPNALNGKADPATALDLLRRAAKLGHVPSQLRLGHVYQFGDLGATIDPSASITYYSLAAQKGSAEAMYELCAWHFTGAEDANGKEVLVQDDEEAYIWARKAAEKGLAKAEYAVGYFTENGIGVQGDMEEALEWYTLAARHGDPHAVSRLEGHAPIHPADPSILAAVVDHDVAAPVESMARREGLDRLFTVRTYRRIKSRVIEHRNLKRAGGL
ncbi:hypothetical protein SpCBS45565_g06741 [Spizellomyces sp. 'palustris']|nr:hypothetical protein SpCBS45565_g06741 [Spizellomyces sp. 'palustris']